MAIVKSSDTEIHYAGYHQNQLQNLLRAVLWKSDSATNYPLRWLERRLSS